MPVCSCDKRDNKRYSFPQAVPIGGRLPSHLPAGESVDVTVAGFGQRRLPPPRRHPPSPFVCRAAFVAPGRLRPGRGAALRAAARRAHRAPGGPARPCAARHSGWAMAVQVSPRTPAHRTASGFSEAGRPSAERQADGSLSARRAAPRQAADARRPQRGDSLCGLCGVRRGL